MPEDYQDTPEERAAWQKDQSTRRMDEAMRRSLGTAFHIKADDDDAFRDLAEMFRRYRARQAFWTELQTGGVKGMLIALASALAVWLGARYGNRL